VDADSRNCYSFGQYCLDADKYVLTKDGQPIQLTPKQFEILLMFVQNAGKVLRKDELLKTVWPDSYVEENNLTQTVFHLRRVLGDNETNEKLIQTIPRVGYRFVAVVKNAADIRIPLEDALEKPAALRMWPYAAGLAIAGLLAAGWYFWPGGATEVSNWKDASFVQLTDGVGEELFVALSPDGSSMAYQSRQSGNWDIYFQRVGGKNPINLTKDSPGADLHPAFSPAGDRIAFHSAREGGGIFVMGATGESVRRVTDSGYHPAWSPTGLEIVFATRDIGNPIGRPPASELWAVTIATGKTRLIAPVDAILPSWSPHGERIAFATANGGRRDVSTVSASGGKPIPVTEDLAVDWDPVWSPDGRYLYFASDRGGTMNLWRVSIDESSGKALGPPESITTPSPYSAWLAFSSDGRRMAYTQRAFSETLYKVSFDPARETVKGMPVEITRGSRSFGQPNPSPDGKWLTFATAQPEDILRIGTDGTGLLQLTDDLFMDRFPRWSPLKGDQIAFQSNRSGAFEIWSIRPDGRDLHQLTFTNGTLFGGAVWSPDGKKLAYNVVGGDPRILEVNKPWQDQHPESLPKYGSLITFWARSWSPNGRWIAGFEEGSGARRGVVIYDFESRRYQRLEERGADSAWLHDSRRILARDDARLFVIDISTKKPREILSVAPDLLGPRQSLSPDDRTIYFGIRRAEADVWLMSRD
jgi:Tol biopolymer transport system component/DNA-binding winged helix-turn-helix (wHTH) protein